MSAENGLGEILEAADDAFGPGMTLAGGVWSGNTDVGKAERLLGLLDAALSGRPRDTTLLMAKAAVQFRLMQHKSCERTIDEVLSIDPGHMDASRKKENWPNWRLLFDFPSWTETSASAAPLYAGSPLGSLKPSGVCLYLARAGLRVSCVVVQSVDGLVFDRGVDAAMRSALIVKAVRTPHGPLGPYYVLLEDNPSAPFKREAFLTLGAIPGQPQPEDGYWLAKRLARQAEAHIVFVSGTKVLYNRRFEFSQPQAAELARAVAEIGAPAPTDADAYRRAQQWYMNNSSLDDVRFPG
jgi:hypothetical protein